MEPAVTIQDFLPWATLAAITIGIVWIVIQNVSSKLSSQIEATNARIEATNVRIEATNVRIEAVGKVGESSIARIEAAIQAGTQEHEQFRSDIKQANRQIADTNKRLDDLFQHLLSTSKQ